MKLSFREAKRRIFAGAALLFLEIIYNSCMSRKYFLKLREYFKQQWK